MLDTVLPILNTGAVGAMLIMVWKWSMRKDRKSYEMIEAQNEERRQMYESMKELVKEVTEALVYKNMTDDKMAAALEKLTEQLRALKQTVKDNTNETT